MSGTQTGVGDGTSGNEDDEIDVAERVTKNMNNPIEGSPWNGTSTKTRFKEKRKHSSPEVSE